jgi:hypothetical protein
MNFDEEAGFAVKNSKLKSCDSPAGPPTGLRIPREAKYFIFLIL